MQITWTYYILASGLKEVAKTKVSTFYWRYYLDVGGKGISIDQKNFIKNTILSLEESSCSLAGKELGRTLSQKDSQPWTSICKSITFASNGILLFTTN